SEARVRGGVEEVVASTAPSDSRSHAHAVGGWPSASNEPAPETWTCDPLQTRAAPSRKEKRTCGSARGAIAWVVWPTHPSRSVTSRATTSLDTGVNDSDWLDEVPLEATHW